MIGAKNTPKVEIPYDPLNEQILIVAAVRGDEALRERMVRRIGADAFLVKEHVVFWTALVELVRRKLAFSSATMQQLSGGKLDLDYVSQILDDRADVSNVEHHIRMLEWDRTRVATVQGPVTALLEALRDPATPPERVRGIAKQLAEQVDRGTTSSLLRNGSAVAQSAIVELEKRSVAGCYPTGIELLDRDEKGEWRLLPGLAPGDVSVVTGLSGSGKSTVAMRIALAQWRLGRKVLIGAWEPGDEDTLQLLAAMHLGMNRTTVTTGQIKGEERKRFEQALEEIAQDVVFMRKPRRARGTKGRDWDGNERAVEQIGMAIQDCGADVAIFDLWKRCLVDIRPEAEELVLDLQQDVFKETNCHGMLLQQQRLKDVEQRDDKRPTREGMKGSSAWTEVADLILGVHRPALWKSVPDTTLEIDILKQRWGVWPQAIEFDWDPKMASVTGGKTVLYDQPIGAERSPEDDFLGGGGPRFGKGPSRKKRKNGWADE